MAEAEAEAKVKEEEVEELKVEVEGAEDEGTEVKGVEVEGVEEVEVEGAEVEEVEEVEVEGVEVVETAGFVEVLELLLEALTVLLKSYKSSLFGPPQNSDRFPLQGILHPVKPSGAGPPPLEKTLPQSIKQDILCIIRKMYLIGRWVERRETYSTLWHIQHQREYIPLLGRRMCRDQHSYWPLRPGQQYRL
jgi:hypothetical protein